MVVSSPLPQTTAADAVLPLPTLAWLADQNLLRQVLRAQLLDQALANDVLTPDEQQQALAAFTTQHNLATPEAIQHYCRRTLLTPATFQGLAERPLKLQQHCHRHYAHQAEARFLTRKNNLDQVVYSLLRLQDPGLARELYLRIADGEADFAQLAQQFSQGPERHTRGIVGPVPIEQAHPELVLRLRTTRPGELVQPFRVDTWWRVLRVESYAPASFDDRTRNRMANELFEEWLEAEIDSQIAALGQQLER
jgi:parvulin-like peptidyl-prolyl isomerase